jgi:tRNA A-37 threonylcarbamoyl transferase component Bud32
MNNKIIESVEQNLNIKVSKIELFGQGKCNFIYLVNAESGEQFIVKKERGDKETEEQNHIITEARIIQYLKNKLPNLEIPAIRFYDENVGLYCYNFISGKPMKITWQDLNEVQRITLCKNLGKFHAKFHSSLSLVEVEQLGLVINQNPELEGELLNHLDSVFQTSDVPENLVDIIENALKIYNKTSKEVHFSLIHNDIHDENILIDKDSISAIIDFGDTEFDDIRKDFHRYVSDYPDYFDYILDEYKNNVNFPVSKARIVAYTILLLAWKIDSKKISSSENQDLFKQIFQISKLLK